MAKLTQEEAAKLLAGRVNQPHYVEAVIRKVVDAECTTLWQLVDEQNKTKKALEERVGLLEEMIGMAREEISLKNEGLSLNDQIVESLRGQIAALKRTAEEMHGQIVALNRANQALEKLVDLSPAKGVFHA